MLLQIFIKFRKNGVPAKISFEYGAVRAEKHNLRNALDAVQFCRNLPGIDNLAPHHTVLRRSPFGVLRLVPDSDAQDFKALRAIGLISLADVGNLSLAWAAPACPEIHEHIFPFANIVRERNALPV